MMDISGMFSRSVRVLAVALLFVAPAVAQEIQIEPGGTVEFPQIAFPPSSYYSEAGTNSTIEHI